MPRDITMKQLRIVTALFAFSLSIVQVEAEEQFLVDEGKVYAEIIISETPARSTRLLDLRGNILCFLRISYGKMHDVNILDELPIEPGAFYIMDKAYIDYARLYRLHQQAAFFLTRVKKNLDAKRRESRIIDRATGLRSDQTIVLAGVKSSQSYPEALRRIHYFDVETGKRFVFLTNNFVLPALLIAQL
jgi:hypothetical protein